MDIVGGLRAAGGAPTQRLDCANCHSRMLEAANEIERLRAYHEICDRQRLNERERAMKAEAEAYRWEKEAERLRALWFSDTDPHETEYAEQYATYVEAALVAEGE